MFYIKGPSRRKQVEVFLSWTKEEFHNAIKEQFPQIDKSKPLIMLRCNRSRKLVPIPSHIQTPSHLKEWNGMKRSSLYVSEAGENEV